MWRQMIPRAHAVQLQFPLLPVIPLIHPPPTGISKKIYIINKKTGLTFNEVESFEFMYFFDISIERCYFSLWHLSLAVVVWICKGGNIFGMMWGRIRGPVWHSSLPQPEVRDAAQTAVPVVTCCHLEHDIRMLRTWRHMWRWPAKSMLALLGPWFLFCFFYTISHIFLLAWFRQFPHSFICFFLFFHIYLS